MRPPWKALGLIDSDRTRQCQPCVISRPSSNPSPGRFLMPSLHVCLSSWLRAPLSTLPGPAPKCTRYLLYIHRPSTVHRQEVSVVRYFVLYVSYSISWGNMIILSRNLTTYSIYLVVCHFHQPIHPPAVHDVAMPRRHVTLRTAPCQTHSLLDAATAERVPTSRHRAGLLHCVTADAALCCCLQCRYHLLEGCVALFDELLLAPLESLVVAKKRSRVELRLLNLFMLPLVVVSSLLLERRCFHLCP